VEVDIDNRIRNYINQFGSTEELERVAGKSVYQLKEDFKEGIRDQKLSQAMRNKVVQDIRITPKEVQEYFNRIPTDSLPLYESEVEIGQIVIFPKASRDAEEYAIQQLKEFKEQIESGKKDFCTVSNNNNEDPGSKEKCGQYEINRSQKNLDPTWLSKAFSLKEGQISSPFKSRFGYHIIQLVSRSGDDAVVRHILKIPQVTKVELKETLERLDSVRAKLITGNMLFGEAVNKYSNDEESKFTAGMLQGSNGSFLTIDQLDKDMVVMLKELKVGQYSQPVEYTDQTGKKGVRIVFLKTKSEPHRENLKDDYNRIATRALEDKKNEALDAWFIKKIPGYYIMLDDDYKSCPSMQKWTTANTASKN
jgi:peptidyl-prolyl cis-trans isomerase SurA